MANITMKINKDLTISGNIQAEKEDGQIVNVVYLNARLSTQGGADAISQTIQDKTIYNQNRTAIRQQVNVFTQEVYDAQDNISGGGEDPEEEAAAE